MKRILLLGGTGAMGVHLAELAVNAGWAVSVTTRGERVGQNGVNFICGNARDEQFLQRLLTEHWDVIVDFMVYRTDEFANRFNRLLAACDQYLYLSSARVYADSEAPITEESPRLLDVSVDSKYLATDEYALSKARQENLLFESDLSNWTIIRPYITYSEQRLQLGVLEKEAWLYRALKGRTVVFCEAINERATTITHGCDVASTMLLLCGNKAAHGEAYQITSGNSLRWSHILDIYQAVFQEAIGRRFSVELESTETFVRAHGSRYQIIYDRLLDRSFDISKLCSLLGDRLQDFVDPVNGLEQCLKAFLQNPAFLAIDWRFEAIKDRITHERASFSEVDSARSKIKYYRSRYF